MSENDDSGNATTAPKTTVQRPKPDLRARALMMHKKLKETMATPAASVSNGTLNTPTIDSVFEEEIEGAAIGCALDLLKNKKYSKHELNTNGLYSNSYYSTGSLEYPGYSPQDMEMVHNIVEGLKKVELNWKEEEIGSVKKKCIKYQELEAIIKESLDSKLSCSDQSKELNHKSGNNHDGIGEGSSCAEDSFLYKYEIVGARDKGARYDNEDYFVVYEHMNEMFGLKSSCGNPGLYVGLFDGHLGKQAAEYSILHLHVNIIRDKCFANGNWHQAIINGFIKTDETFNHTAELKDLKCGTTAISAFIKNDTIYIGNCGDSQAILATRNAEVKLLSNNHSPNREDEKQRIQAGGGKVVWYGTWRVNGVLSVSRSIGDKEHRNLVIAEPEVQEHKLTAEDEFLLLASDGLFEVMKPQDVIDFVREAAKTKPRKEIASALLSQAVDTLNSKDNVSVVIVFFDFV